MEKNTRIYNNVKLGKNVIIEDFCIIGYPPFGANDGELETVIGDNAIIRSHTIIYAGNCIGNDFTTGHHVVIREKNIIGNRVSVGTLSCLEHHLVIEDNVRIHSQAFIPEFSTLKADCWIGPNVVITNAKYPRSTHVKNNLHGAVIERNAKLGANVTLLPGIKVGEDALVGAGSVVVRDVAAYQVVAGNPAHMLSDIRDNKEYEIRKKEDLKMNIPFMNLKESLKEIKNDVFVKLDYLLENTQFIGGEEVRLFEEEFAKYNEARYAVGCSNGTDAIVISLKALGIGSGDTVLVPVNTFIATAEAVTIAGANVDFIDIDPKTYTIDLNMLEKYLATHKEKNIKAVIPVHLYGQMVNMAELKKIADIYDLKIIEDSAQAHGATFNNYYPGYFSDAASFSFYPGKNLGAFGDAGAIITNNEELYKRCKMLSDHGRWQAKYEHAIEGYNKRLDTVQAAILRIKLKRLTSWVEKRQAKAAYFISQLQTNNRIVLPAIDTGNAHAWHLFVIRVKNRDQVRTKLKELNIETGIHYPIPLHLQPAYRYKNYSKGDFPVAEQLAAEILSLPLWPEISNQQQNYICESLVSVL